MKSTLTILALLSISSTVFASSVIKMDEYSCGLQVGKSLAKLANTSAGQDAINLSEDIPNYSAQTKLSSKLKNKSERDLIAQAANNSWQSIVYSMAQIKRIAAQDAALIDTACGMGIDQ